MEFNKKTDFYTLSNGRTFYAYNDMLCPTDDAKWLCYGSDGVVEPDYDENGDEVAMFTEDERREIANHMIARWNRWASIKVPE